MRSLHANQIQLWRKKKPNLRSINVKIRKMLGKISTDGKLLPKFCVGKFDINNNSLRYRDRLFYLYAIYQFMRQLYRHTQTNNKNEMNIKKKNNNNNNASVKTISQNALAIKQTKRNFSFCSSSNTSTIRYLSIQKDTQTQVYH